jgi:hypothetical protein
MNSLLYSIQKLSIPIEYKKLSCFYEIKSSVIFNCTGMGSGELNSDKDCYPICGHGVIFDDEKISNYGYILRLATVPELGEDSNNGPLYFMPKSSGFIGGTYVKEYNGKDDKYNRELITKLIHRSKFLFNGVHPKKAENLMKPKF